MQQPSHAGRLFASQPLRLYDTEQGSNVVSTGQMGLLKRVVQLQPNVNSVKVSTRPKSFPAKANGQV